MADRTCPAIPKPAVPAAIVPTQPGCRSAAWIACPRWPCTRLVCGKGNRSSTLNIVIEDALGRSVYVKKAESVRQAFFNLGPSRTVCRTPEAGEKLLREKFL